MTTAVQRELILKWAGRGYTPLEIGNLLKLPTEQVMAIIENPDGQSKHDYRVEFIEPPSFDGL